MATQRGMFFEPGPRAALYMLASVTLNLFATLAIICLHEGRHFAFAPLETPLAAVAERFFLDDFLNFSSHITEERFFLP